MRQKLILIVAALVLLAGSARAQTICEANCVLRVGDPFIAFTETMDGATYRIYLNGIAQPVIGALVNGFVEFAFPGGLLVGVYAIVIELVKNGASVLTDPVTLTVQRRRVRVKG